MMSAMMGTVIILLAFFAPWPHLFKRTAVDGETHGNTSEGAEKERNEPVENHGKESVLHHVVFPWTKKEGWLPNRPTLSSQGRALHDDFATVGSACARAGIFRGSWLCRCLELR